MLSVQEAKNLITQHTTTLLPTKTALQNAALKVLAADTYAPLSIPPFNQSSMDGYAFNYADWKKNNHLIIMGEAPAGITTPVQLAAQQAVRIFTGAPVPQGADTVVMQEKVLVKNDMLIINDEELTPGSNVRPMGSEIEANAIAIKKGTVLTPAAIGFLAGIGIDEIPVYPSPNISIIVTGNELQQPGNTLQYGQVYESNSFSLQTALQQMYITPVSVNMVQDDFDKLKNSIEAALQNTDLILLTGGVSVGDYDYVANALQACGVVQLFHKVKQKPGKPLYFGKKNETLIFGLPGNPSSVLSCFYQYVYPCIYQQMGHSNKSLQTIQVPLTHDYDKKPGLTHFIKALYSNGAVTPLQAQESYRLQSFAVGNCLVCLPEEGTHFAQGDIVTAYLLPT